MLKLTLPPPAGKSSGGGAEVYRNFCWAQACQPSLFCEKGQGGLDLILRNNTPLGNLIKRDFIALPQNAWAWIGRMPKDPSWLARRAGFRVTGDLSIARAKAVIRLSESVPSGDSPSLVLPNVLSDEFEELAREVRKTTPPSRGAYLYSFGNFIDYRNYDGLIKSFLASGDKRTLVIHGGVLSTSYLAVCESAAIGSAGRVELDPVRKERLEILRHIYWSDGVIFPSTAEASPISLLETVSLGKAVLCNDIPGHTQSLLGGSAIASAIDINDAGKVAAAIAQIPPSNGLSAYDPVSTLAINNRVEARELWLNRLCDFVSTLN